MSSKQMARTVQDGKMVTFSWPGTDEIHEGYLCGQDDFHWMIVTPLGGTFLVHKSAPLISISPEATYDRESEDHRRVMERIVGPFRQSLQEQGLVRSTPVSATPEGLSA